MSRFTGRWKAQRSWLCTSCCRAHSAKVNKCCASCGSADLLYFQSHHELKRWLDLELLQEAGDITDLKRQRKFELGDVRTPGGRIMTHTVDFEYTENGVFVLEDAKGVDTDLGHIKRELVRVFHGFEIKLY